jgi:hypothetical protein
MAFFGGAANTGETRDALEQLEMPQTHRDGLSLGVQAVHCFLPMAV